MARNMSFIHTQDQIRDRSKTVTRRLGWLFLKPGDVLKAVNKCQGLKKGEHPEVLAVIRVKSVRQEPLRAIHGKYGEVQKEGFLNHPEVQGSPLVFIDFFCRINPKCTPETLVTRIEFEYI